MSKRVSLILQDADEALIAPYLSKDSTMHEVLRRWAIEHTGIDIKSEASALRLLLHAGVEALNEHALDAGYASYADEFNTAQANAERRTIRDRQAQRTAAPK